MRNLLAFLATAVLVFLGLGWYLNWYSFRSVPADPGHRSYTIELNSDKISRDISKGEDKLSHALEKDKSSDSAAKK